MKYGYLIILFFLFFIISCHTNNKMQQDKIFKQNLSSTSSYKLKLKKNGKCVEYRIRTHSLSTKKHKGKWELHGDTLILQYKKFGLGKNRTFKHFINEDFTKIYLLNGTELFIEDMKKD
ncbi:MAG: hypothetical protein LBQ22_01525 [Bacteroidales bacterium]|jgi:hypothetical protein|nr:hypothetical protein [Bacteroidales bacterium]